MRALLLAIAAGALLPLGLAPFGAWPLLLLGLVLWSLLALTAPGPGALLWRGWGLALGKYAVGVSWVWVSIHEHGDAGVVLASVMTALFVLGLSAFGLVLAAGTALALRLLRPASARLPTTTGRMKPTGADAPAAVVAVTVGWACCDWLLTWVLTGFPWLFPGYALTDTSAAAWGAVIGVQGLGAWLVAIAAGIALVLAGRRSLAGVVTLTGLAAGLFAGGALLAAVDWTEPAGPPRTAALVQASIPQAQKWRPGTYGWIRDRHLELTEPHWGVDVIVWPEGAITRFRTEAAPLLELLDARGRASGSALVTGIPAFVPDPGTERWQFSGRFRNTAVALGTGSGDYVKRRLVPFGEYVPLEDWLRGLIGLFDLPMSRNGAGPWQQPLLDLDGQPAAMAICYEIVFPGIVRSSAREASVLLTISNDAWFGASIGPSQHLQMARMRAIENGKAVLRATNDGLTAIIDAHGRLTATLPRFATATLVGRYQPRQGSTPYGRFGETGLLLLAGIAFTLAAWQWRRSGVVSSRA